MMVNIQSKGTGAGTALLVAAAAGVSCTLIGRAMNVESFMRGLKWGSIPTTLALTAGVKIVMDGNLSLRNDQGFDTSGWVALASAVGFPALQAMGWGLSHWNPPARFLGWCNGALAVAIPTAALVGTVQVGN